MVDAGAQFDPSLASKNMPKTQTTPVRNMDKVGGGENTVLRMTPAPLTGGGATIYRKLGDSEGYPRGYSPDRMNELKMAESVGKVQIHSDAPADNMTRIKDSARNRTGVRHHPEHEKARAREIIARSKVDVSSLPEPTGDFNSLNMNRSSETSPLNITATERISSAGVYSFYKNSKSKRKLAVNPDTLFPEKSSQTWPAGDALIHEMGHDDDNITGVTQGVMEYTKNIGGFPKKPELFEDGHYEGYADKFATDNYVADPRDAKRNLNKSSTYAGFAAIGSAMPKGRSLASWAKGYKGSGAKPSSRGDAWLDSQTDVAENTASWVNAHPDDTKFDVPKGIAPNATFTAGDIMRASGREVPPKPKKAPKAPSRKDPWKEMGF
jgi:hypothetical protein